jgi:hypothetical protein
LRFSPLSGTAVPNGQGRSNGKPWLIKRIENPVIGPKIAAKTVTIAAGKFGEVLGIPEGIVTKRINTKNNTVPMPTAAAVLIGIIFFSIMPPLSIRYE